MTVKAAPIVLLLLCVCVLPAKAQGEDEAYQKIFSGMIGVAGKYDSNLDLTNEDAAGKDLKDDFIGELRAKVSVDKSWGQVWNLEFDLYGLAGWPYEHRDDSWYVGHGDLFLGYSFGKNTLSVLNEARYFTEPANQDYDYFRNSATAAYKRTLSRLWQLRIGYENIVNLYPESTFFNYYVNGGFLEIRNTWTPLFSTYYSYDFQYYRGSYNSSTSDPPSSPEAGLRHTGAIGFNWFFAKKNLLNGAYTFQVDDSSNQGLQQIGEFDDYEDESLETDAEFNFVKHKGDLLYSHKFNDRINLSLYQELIYKSFLERNEEYFFDEQERMDLLFLSSAWIKIRLYRELYVMPRYVFRMNDSTLDIEDFQDHILYLGVQYQF